MSGDTKRIPMSAAVTALDIATEYAVFYYDLQGRDILAVEDPFESDEAVQDLQDEVEAHPERYVVLPGHAELEAANVPLRFAGTQEGHSREKLKNAARGLYANTEFPALISEMGLSDEWTQFRDEALADIAREWAERNSIEFE